MSNAAFLAEVEKAIVLYEKAIGHAASRTRNMIAEHGESEALSRLMVSPDLRQGFEVLRDREQLDKTFEAVVVRFQDSFGRDAIEAAKRRLAHPYDLL